MSKELIFTDESLADLIDERSRARTAAAFRGFAEFVRGHIAWDYLCIDELHIEAHRIEHGLVRGPISGLPRPTEDATIPIDAFAPMAEIATLVPTTFEDREYVPPSFTDAKTEGILFETHQQYAARIIRQYAERDSCVEFAEVLESIAGKIERGETGA